MQVMSNAFNGTQTKRRYKAEGTGNGGRCIQGDMETKGATRQQGYKGAASGGTRH